MVRTIGRHNNSQCVNSAKEISPCRNFCNVKNSARGNFLRPQQQLYCQKIRPGKGRILYEYVSETLNYLLCSIAAWAADNRAIGTRNGEQET